jgi:serine/threonine-protein kinase
VDDTYEIDARLGAGAMGEVYAARHVKLGKRVAIKVISQRLSEDEAAIERFTMEARTLAQIQHPAIVAVEHVGELADGRAYFVMELLRGESLFERLQRGRIPLPEALRILDQMARGLDAAHGEGVTHRDLKPENTFLVHLPGEPPAIKLLDFGLAKLAADRAGEDRRAERTQSGVAIGTPMYMSPEQMRGPDVDHRTDIYALGCVAYEMLLGEVPFPHATTVPELYAAHLHEAPPLPRSIWPEIPPQLDLALFAMLAKEPAHRPTLAQFRAVVAAARNDDPQHAPTEFVGPRPIMRTKKLRIAVVALFGGIAIGAAVMSGSKKDAPVTSTPPVPTHVTAPVTQPPIATADASAPSVDTTAKIPSAPARTSPSRGPKRVAPPPTAPAVAVDAGVAETPDPPQRPKPPPPPVDRNQTINPFKRKVNP